LLLHRFAACASGLAFGLALAVRPAGLAEGPTRTMRPARAPAGAQGAAIGKGAAIVDEQQRPAMAMSCCRLVLPVCVASAG
jgi:hypothetical protein